MGKKSKKKQAQCVSAPGVQLKVGDSVTLKDLKSSGYNGKSGKAVSLPKSNDVDCRYGVLLNGKKAPVAIRQRNIDISQASRKSTKQQLEERKQYCVNEIEGADSMNADQLAMMRMTMNMFMTDKMQTKIFGRRIEPMPNFVEELRLNGGFPYSINKKWAEKYLRTAFEQKHNLPHFFEMHIKFPNYKPKPLDLMLRLGSNDPKKLEWYCGRQFPGNIFPRQVHAYTTLLRHSFSNQVYRNEVLHQGTTHVAVGFVDLGILFAATLQAEKSGPLRFLGIEMSAYAVAKTLVIWEMLKQTPSENQEDHLRHVMQAWFSTTLDPGAVITMKNAFAALHAPSKDKQYHPDVKELIDHWHAAATTPLSVARSQHANFTYDGRSCIGDLQRKNDRIAMSRYEITGDFGVKSDKPYGNTLKFDCPDGTAPLAKDETVFSALDWKDVVNYVSPGRTIVEAAEMYVMKNLSKLACWASQGRVVVELVCAKIEDIVEDIVAARPWTMSWSNVLDYVDHQGFHEMARACSAHGDTIHFGYSMNWIMDVFGVSIIDYQGEKQTAFRAQLIETANDAVVTAYKAFGWDRYLRLPPPVHPINTTAHYGLERLYYKTWVEHFFAIGKCSGPCNVANFEHAFGSPLSMTGASTVSFTWTYDPKIKFNNVPPMT